MIKLIIQIEELSDDPRKAVNGGWKTEKERPTTKEDSLAQGISPALKELLKKLLLGY
jgi:hypothetical protein